MIGFKQYGNGQEKVMVFSGWMGDHSVFKPAIDCLDLKRFSYIFMDYRGYGESKKMKGDFSILEIAKDAIELARHLKIEKMSIIGHSMGGMVVQKITTLEPNLIDKIIALTPVPASGYPMNEEFQGLFEGSVASPELREKILDFTTGERLPAQWVKKMCKSSLETTTPEAFGGYLKAWTKTDFSKEVQGLNHSILVCVGEHDPAIPLEMISETYKKWMPQCEVKTLPCSGHYPMQETPLWLTSTIEEFLSRD